MEKLVFVYNYGTCEGDCGTDIIPFEYTSKDNFIFDALESVSILKQVNKKRNHEIHDVYILNCYLSFDFVESELESSVYTLDEWFTRYKTVPFVRT